MTSGDQDRWKAAAAAAAVAMIRDGMIVGLGSGSTSSLAVGLIGQRVAAGMRIIGVATSEETARQARDLAIPLSTLDAHDAIDLTIDGADEVDSATLNLLKGRGGALLREKLVASVSRTLVIIVDETKVVARLGVGSSVPVEVVPFGWPTTAQRLRKVAATTTLRTTSHGAPFVTDGGHYILDCAFDGIDDPQELQRQLDGTVGVVEHGLFVGLACRVIVGGVSGVRTIERADLA